MMKTDTAWSRRVARIRAQALLEGGTSEACNPQDPLVRSKVLKLLRKPITMKALSERLGFDPHDVVQDLEDCGYIVTRRGAALQIGAVLREGTQRIIQENQFVGKTMKIGVVADMHLGSRYARLDVLAAAYAEFVRQGITTVLCPGNYIDGEAKFNTHDLLVHGIADQVQYAIDQWPGGNGIQTYFIDGDDHEGWYHQREGIETGRYLMLEAQAQGRTDLTYLGYMEADFILRAPRGQAVVKVIHAGGGSAYAYSYSSQKLAESFQGGEKPHVAIIGHYHKQEYCFPRNVHCVQAGCCQDQTPFMRKKKLAAHVGFCILTIQQDLVGSISRFGVEFFPFWDRGYYTKRDGSAEVTKRLQG